jgi:predicted metalloprotease with PDZ domain
MPQASGDGMEHRNSTYVVGSRPLRGAGVMGALGTVSHEFFHCWNVERIRPAALEPFNFEEANMSGELWFAEGFTNYYTGLILCRAGLESQKEYVDGLHGVIDYVVNSPGRSFFNPIEMSYQAPFADAATSIDPNYRSNTFISYYVYGQVLGLALDLQLRNEKGDLSLDGFMKFAWNRFGKTELPYNVRDLQTALAAYASPAFANLFFDSFIFQSHLPDYEKLLGSVGIAYAQAQPSSYLGASIEKRDSALVIAGYSAVGGPAYNAGLERDDQILSIDNQKFVSAQDLTAFIAKMAPGTLVKVTFLRNGTTRTVDMTVAAMPAKKTTLFEEAGRTAGKATVARREAWLKPR